MTILDFTPLQHLWGPEPEYQASGPAQPDRRDGAIYDLVPELRLAVEVALTTGRPLLLRGDPGSGKSSLAPYVARRLGWRYYEQVVTSQTTATDLLYHYDAVRRLGDAYQPGGVHADVTAYVDPGVMWWAFDRDSAANRGGPKTDSPAVEPGGEANADRDSHRAVVLIDEIDKAHPDVPNGLLAVLSSYRLDIPWRAEPVELEPPADAEDQPQVAPLLVVITTNNERELPAAFMRRCLVWTLEHPDTERLVTIARRHVDTPDDPFTPTDEALARALAGEVESSRKEAAGVRKPSTAEFLDAFRACRTVGIRPGDEDERWLVIRRLTLEKPEETPW
jgi:MoxR-like ATPase